MGNITGMCSKIPQTADKTGRRFPLLMRHAQHNVEEKKTCHTHKVPTHTEQRTTQHARFDEVKTLSEILLHVKRESRSLNDLLPGKVSLLLLPVFGRCSAVPQELPAFEEL